MWKSSHSSRESPELLLELEKSEPGCRHDVAQLAAHQSPDPGGHTALAEVDPRFVPPSLHRLVQFRDTEDDPRFVLPSLNPLSKEEEPLDATQDFLFLVPVLTTSYHDPNAATNLKLHELEPWPGDVTY